VARLPNAIILSLKLVKHIEPNKPINRYIESVVLIVLIVIYGGATFERNSIWENDPTLWSDTIHKSPGKARPHNNLGVAYTEKGLMQKAIIEIEKALMLKPDFINAHVSLGNAYMAIGLTDMAAAQYKEALRFKPDYGEVYVNLGNTYVKRGMIDEAIAEYKEAISLKPGYAPAHTNLASAYGLMGLTEEAVAQYKAAIILEPDNPDIHYNLGIAYENLAGRYGQEAMSRELRLKAINEYRITLRLNTHDIQARERMTRLISH